jgi:hypothetical protein
MVVMRGAVGLEGGDEAGVDELAVVERTEQEPHSPSPQPSFVPVRWRSSRRTSRRRFMGGTFRWWLACC